MKILILGGTKFVGRHAAVEAVARGHDVTLFNRGHDIAPEGVITIIGDRLLSGGYSSLDRLSFDAVIDTWSTDPVAVKSAVEALHGRIGQYIYVSSGRVYNFEAEGAAAPYSESTPIHDPKKVDDQYIKDKIGGERYASQSGVPAAFIRAGVILGPYEDGGRLPWWLKRMVKGGPTLAPGPKSLGLQFIDGRDLAKFMINAVEDKLEGPFNLVSELDHISMVDFLDTIRRVTGEHAQLCWLESEKVKEAGIKRLNELPLCLPPDFSSIFKIDVTKAIKAGLKIRNAKETILDTWEWVKTLDKVPSYTQVGLNPEKELEILKKYFEEKRYTQEGL